MRYILATILILVFTSFACADGYQYGGMRIIRPGDYSREYVPPDIWYDWRGNYDPVPPNILIPRRFLHWGPGQFRIGGSWNGKYNDPLLNGAFLGYEIPF